jgi:hypothetical protein
MLIPAQALILDQNGVLGKEQNLSDTSTIHGFRNLYLNKIRRPEFPQSAMNNMS